MLPDDLVLVSGCSTESLPIANTIMASGKASGSVTFCGVFIPGLNKQTYLASDKSRVLTFFMTPELAVHSDQVEFLPLCYDDIVKTLCARKPAAMLAMVAPPDKDGYCSFGADVHLMGELWEEIPIRIAHINPLMPRTHGHRGIPHSELTAFFQAEQALLTSTAPRLDDGLKALAGHVMKWIPNGATLQTGVGRIPDAVLEALINHKDLRIHSGLVGDGTLALRDAGALASGFSATVGVAIGSQRLYDAISEEPFSFQPVSTTHGLEAIAACEKFRAINSATAIDLFGQAYAEATPSGLMSGPGGASDFSRGAREGGGLRIVALPATAGRDGSVSRIVAPGDALGPVSLSRMDIDIVATEYGSIDLRGIGYNDRAKALITIAAPQHRDQLESQWAEINQKL